MAESLEFDKPFHTFLLPRRRRFFIYRALTALSNFFENKSYNVLRI